MAKKQRRRKARIPVKFTIAGLDQMIVFADGGSGLNAVPPFLFSHKAGVIRIVNTTDHDIEVSCEAFQNSPVEVPAVRQRNANIDSRADPGIYPTEIVNADDRRKRRRRKKARRRLLAGSDPDIIIT